MYPNNPRDNEPLDVDESAWRRVEDELLAQAREISRAIVERVRSITAEKPKSAEDMNKQ
jgi:hypothetical protein